MDKILSIYRDKKLAQTGVIIVPSTGNETIFEYGMAIAAKWKLGNQDQDNGLLIILAMDDRAIRIFTGYGLESSLPDESLTAIITNDMLPHFKQSAYANGILARLDKIESQLETNRRLIGLGK